MKPNHSTERPTMVDHLRPVGDAAAYAGAVASICGLLQPIAAFIASLLSILWLCMQIRDYLRKKKEGA
jgi:hypothetical protein